MEDLLLTAGGDVTDVTDEGVVDGTVDGEVGVGDAHVDEDVDVDEDGSPNVIRGARGRLEDETF